nr:hypothetical protein [Tanacetum cinerariifolium]
MSGKDPDEMAPKSSKTVVLPKFDMYIYTPELTSSELTTAIEEYGIPMDLHPRLPFLGMTMNRLPSRYIRLYIEQLDQGGLRIPFSSFFLAVIKHFKVHVSQFAPMGGNWFYFENKTEGRAKKCFKEVTSSLKGWKKKFFLVDHCAVPNVMPWRHSDTNLHDDFPTNYNENDVARLSEFLVPLRPPPRRLLYVYGLTTVCRYPELRYNIKDQDKNVIDIDTLLKLPTWTDTVDNKGDPIPEKQRPKLRGEEGTQNLAKATAKHAGAGGVEGSKKKRKDTLNAEKVIVDLSGNTRVSTSPAEVNGLHFLVNIMMLVSLQSMMEKIRVPEREKLALSAQVAQADADRKKLVREFILALVKRLHTSVEYRKSLAAPVLLCFTVGWLGGLSLGRVEDQIAKFLSEAQHLDIEGSKSWEAKHR